MVEDVYSGTRGWMASEIQDQGAFSPFGAEKWSCEKVLLQAFPQVKQYRGRGCSISTGGWVVVHRR